MAEKSINYEEYYKTEKQKRELYEVAINTIKQLAIISKDNSCVKFNLDNLIAFLDDIQENANNINFDLTKVFGDSNNVKLD